MTETSHIEFDRRWVEQRYGARFQAFQNLMPWRIRDVLIISSLYDLYLFEEDGRLYEQIRNEYQDLYLSHFPEFTRVSSGKEALDLLHQGKTFDLIITTLHIEDMSVLKLGRAIRETGRDTSIVLLAFDNSEVRDILHRREANIFDRMFIWQGDFRLIVAIIKTIEDGNNVANDTEAVGVQSIILIEDSIEYFSSFLPVVYSEVLKQSYRLIIESVSLSDRYLRMRARPKILLASSYEEAWSYYEKYEECLLGIISDVDYERNGKQHPTAGLEFSREVRERNPDLPIILQSTNASFEEPSRKIGTGFLLKHSPVFLYELREFIAHHFGFGDFIFRLRNGDEVGRASDLKSLEERLHEVPAESILFHAERNHFSAWLKARTEFGLARELKPQRVSDYDSTEALRAYLIASLREYRIIRQGGSVIEFNKETYLPSRGLARIGGGSIGGKARGLGFVNTLIAGHLIAERYEGIRIGVPPGIVLGTEVFDRFMEENDLLEYALQEQDDQALVRRFLDTGPFPRKVTSDLSSFLDQTPYPLAVRSSSLLEDSQYHPFAGIYATYMISNNQRARRARLLELTNTIKKVYASTYCRAAKEYVKMTSVRLEEEKMAVVLQRVVGSTHENRFYPDFAGVARSYNFYPIAPQQPDDGIAALALGLGKTVAEGGRGVRFCPRFPKHVFQFSSPKEALSNNQTHFYALKLDSHGAVLDVAQDHFVHRYPTSVAEHDGPLARIGSTYSHENDTITEGLSRSGTRLVSFAPLLQHNNFPLGEIIDVLLKIGSWGMGTPVEMEFAVNLTTASGTPMEFALLQIRPLAARTGELEELDFEEIEGPELLCESDQVLGNGMIRDIADIVAVPVDGFDRSTTIDVAREIATLNTKLMKEGRPYLLIGPGRWGSLDPWLGIPVKWEQICGARAVVESGFGDIDIVPSQGSHFFQNITSFQVAYFTVNPRSEGSRLDWEWLQRFEPAERMDHAIHYRFDTPLTVKVNGHQRKGVILKPGYEEE
ncbi:MAG: histidine kinase [Ignavibacteria bacterium]|nr:histidine kinase [Ignavibacteria bacterium]